MSQYLSSSSRSSISSALDNIANASPFTFNDNERSDLIKALINDLQACSSGDDNAKLVPEDSHRALLALKHLGKQPRGAAIIASPANLSTLLHLSSSTTFKAFPDAHSEALRCIANTLLLIEAARSTWISAEVGGGEAAIKLFETATNPDSIFLASRILFLTTASSASAGDYICSLVQDKHIIDLIASKLDILITAILSGTKMAKEAMTDLLKFTFNLLLHYPKLVDCDPQETGAQSEDGDVSKVMGDYWSSKLDGLLPPLLRAFNALPPTFPAPLAPPLTHVIHALITIPFTSTLRPHWLPPQSPTPPESSRSSSHRQSTSSHSNPGSGSNSPTIPAASTSPTTKTSTLERAFSALSASARSFSRTPSPLHPSTRSDTYLHAYALLDVTLAHFLPGNIDPDDPSVKERCTSECGDTTLDELITPLVVLITRYCIADETCRTKIRESIVPPDLDRKISLESRSDILGRCLRVLSCVYHDRLKESIGEMMFAMCNSDSSTLISLCGYGNVAGYLFNKGIMNAPPSSSSSPSTTSPTFDASINPITGVEDTHTTPLPEMTDEEKEREAEKLFVLFDRLERNGAIQPEQNPVRKAMQKAAGQ
ncbi:hypothetical protein ONZ45_g16415 [Pleurotus djamor]|nr:hypothetical protein ONZ45_g16415 [Pleurotus djamor]